MCSISRIKRNEAKIKATILKEEERFKLTLDKGYQLIESLIESSDKVISGEDAFKLYDTYGFPFELTNEIAAEKGLSVDEAGFKAAMQEQKERARASAQKVVITDDLNYINNPATDFVGYEKFESSAKILSIVDENGNNIEIARNGVFDIILDKTPFYAECGGQAGDSGVLEINGQNFEVIKTFKVQDIFVHRVIVEEAEIKKGEEVFAKIDTKHHSLAHLLQAALQKVLGGKEVHQAGSSVDENRTRYDFTFDRALTPVEIAKVQDQLNTWIGMNLTRTTVVMSIEEANNSGAMASNTYVDGYYLTSNGAMSTAKNEWKKNSTGWWYSYADGSYAIGWALIDNTWYYFNSSGYMQTGWQLIGGTWYYMNSSGAMQTGWQRIGNTWYYFYESGAMATNIYISCGYIDSSGAWTA